MNKQQRYKRLANDPDEIGSEWALSEHILPKDQFEQLSKQINMEAERREQLIDSLYHCGYSRKGKRQVKIQESPMTIYQQQYYNWKQNQQSNQKSSTPKVYSEVQAVLDRQRRKKQLNQSSDDPQIAHAIYTYASSNSALDRISGKLGNQIKNIVSKYSHTPEIRNQFQDFSSLKTVYQKSIQDSDLKSVQSFNDSEKNKNRIIQQQVEKQLLQRIKNIQRQEHLNQERKRKQKQIEHSCFVNLIKSPPQPKSQPVKPQLLANQSKQKYQNSIDLKGTNPKMRKENWRLKVQQMIKLPYKTFLIFYSQNERKLIQLSSPDQLKQLQKYRDEALRREQAVKELRRKVSEGGEEMIKKLSVKQKQKLFEILYGQELGEAKLESG